MLGAVGVLAVLLEYWFFSVPVARVEVIVVGVQSDVPPNEGRPPAYQYRVRLPEGQQMMLTYPRLLKSGTRVVATKTRSRLTGWTRLTGPYQLVESDDGSGTP